MHSAQTIASFFIEQSSEMAENDLTNLKLNKILFYAQAEAFSGLGKPLFVENIEAWPYGPVVSEVYDWLKGCGSYPITTFDIDTSSANNLSSDETDFLEQVWENYGKYSAGYLVEKTHEEGSPWSQVFNANSNKIIPFNLIQTAQLQNEWE